MAKYNPDTEGGRYSDGLELGDGGQSVESITAQRAASNQSSIDIVEVVTIPALAATANNLSLGDGKYFRLSTSGGARIITGFANVQGGREIWLFNTGPNNITLNNQDAGSSAENRIITGSGAAIVIVPDGSAILVYDHITTRWRKVPTV